MWVFKIFNTTFKGHGNQMFNFFLQSGGGGFALEDTNDI